MITIPVIKQLIEENLKILKNPETDLKRAKAKEKLAFLNQCKLYLETEPSEQYIKDQIDVISSRLPDWIKWHSGDPDQLKKQYNNLNDVPKLKVQLKTLKFIYDE